ncbi:MAG TPA: ABC transporter substrate-binding protein [Thermoplasmata archaeon]|nr:ABC transporter substrate-binding protein [Thermoplasmata archaeon]
MARTRKMGALGAVVLMVLSTWIVLSTPASAGNESVEPRQPPTEGPWLDEIVFAEQLDRSLALTEIIAGNWDTIMFDITAPADKRRAQDATELDTFPAYGLFDQITVNPMEQNLTVQDPGCGGIANKPRFPRNPFAIQEIREAMQWLVDRDFVVREIYGGFAIPFRTPFHPRSPDYGRAIVDMMQLEDYYAYDPVRAQSIIVNALQKAGWFISNDGFWHDPADCLVTVKILRRTQDERFQLGAYYGTLLSQIGFNVQLIGVTGAGIPYGGVPNENLWHMYTAGWIQTALQAWDDGQLYFYAGCGFPTPYWCRGPPTYEPPTELVDIAETLAFGEYTSLDQRAQLIRDGATQAMAEGIAMFMDARQSTWINNKRMDNIVWDLFGGLTNEFGLKAAKVPEVAGVQTGRVLNLIMFRDGWNPWVFPGWLYDTVQRRQMTDVAMTLHPHTGRYINVRTNAVPETAGPTGTMAVPDTAIMYNAATDRWVAVAPTLQATSKVTYDMVYGNWHHGPAITMDDVLYSWANMFRRASQDALGAPDGDIGMVPGLLNPAPDGTKYFVNTTLQAINVVDADTLEVYLNFWHPDLQEIAGAGALFPSAPWEVQEVAAKLLLDQVAVVSDADIAATGRLWLDLTKGDSLPYLGEALAGYMGSNHIPPGMTAAEGVPALAEITVAEATARWQAFDAWNDTYGPGNGAPPLAGHFWPSNGPFRMERTDPTSRQTIFKAFRGGYPWGPDQWNSMTVVGIPEVAFRTPPTVVFAGEDAIFNYDVTVGGSPSDAVTALWFMRDTATGAFIKENQVPTRTATGDYRISIPAAETDPLLGTYEVIAVVTGTQAAVPTINRVSFLIRPPSASWFQALLDARAGLIEGEVSDLTGDIAQIRTDLDSLSSGVSGLLGLVVALAILAVIAVVVAAASVLMILRRGRVAGAGGGPPGGGDEQKPPGEGGEEM